MSGGDGDGLRVGLVVPRYAPLHGGVETFTQQAADRLAGLGARVTVITQWPRASALPEAPVGTEAASDVAAGLPVRVERHRLPVGARFDLPSPRAVAAATAPGRFDVLWTHSYHTPLAWLVAERAHTPVVHTPHYHGTGHTRLRAALHRPYRLAGRRLLAASSRVVVGSDAEASLLRRDFPRDAAPDKVVVVPLAVDDPLGGRPRSVPPGPPIVLTVARQESYKRTDVLVRAVVELCRRGVPLRLVVVGDGAALAELRRLAAELSAGEAVTFAGRVDEQALTGWWSAASVYASASEQEAFGIGLGQAFRAGLPAVASDIPAHREVAARSGPETVVEFVSATAPGDGARTEAATRGYVSAIRRALAAPAAHQERAASCALDTAASSTRRLLDLLTAAVDSEPTRADHVSAMS